MFNIYPSTLEDYVVRFEDKGGMLGMGCDWSEEERERTDGRGGRMRESGVIL